MDEDPRGASRDRRDPGADRDRIADDRDRRADDHDQASEARDNRADERDERAVARERTAEVFDVGAGADRRGALRDRQGGASDRTQSGDDRRAASADRADSARDRAVSSIDALTGAYRRDAGIVELKREIARAKRTQQPFALAFVDVDDLKGMNDSLGHAAGDRLLRETADSIRAHLRSYDLIIRFGGDEFLCGLLDVTMQGAAKRFSLVNADLAATQQASLTVGLAELAADDALEDLIARADQALYSERQRLRSAGA
jgi:diguanylate cyclase (GGDEF)-like protein